MSDWKYNAKNKNITVSIILLCFQMGLQFAYFDFSNGPFSPLHSGAWLPCLTLPMDRTEDGDAETCWQPKLPGKLEDGAEPFILIPTVPGFQLRNVFCHLFFIMVIECNWKVVQRQVNLIPYLKNSSSPPAV